jgi:hypothetical protein
MNPDHDPCALRGARGYPTSGPQRAHGSVPYAPPQPFYVQPPPARAMDEHRGAMVLTFGLLAWMFCFAFGIVAWYMGRRDLAAMKAGTMDRAGEGLTTAGYWLGLTNLLLTLLMLPFFLLVLFVAFGALRF